MRQQLLVIYEYCANKFQVGNGHLYRERGGNCVAILLVITVVLTSN